MRSFCRLLLALCTLAIFASCSLEYANIDATKSSSPEFVFYDAEFTRTEDNKKLVEMNATQLEQYSGIDAMYIEDVVFTVYDSDKKASITGSCNLLSADMENDIFHFFGDVTITSYEHDAKVTAQNLRWNNKTEILSSGLTDAVRISTGSGQTLEATNNVTEPVVLSPEGILSDSQKQTLITIEGTGFSARGINLSYSFDGPVTGSIVETTKPSTDKQLEVLSEN